LQRKLLFDLIDHFAQMQLLDHLGSSFLGMPIFFNKEL